MKLAEVLVAKVSAASHHSLAIHDDQLVMHAIAKIADRLSPVCRDPHRKPGHTQIDRFKIKVIEKFDLNAVFEKILEQRDGDVRSPSIQHQSDFYVSLCSGN